MANKKIDNYVTTRYGNWLDYAKYQARVNKIEDANELLNEVLCEILSSKSNEELERMIEEQSSKGSELDFFVLYMIKLNSSSMTSRYRYKFRREKLNYEADVSQYEIEESEQLHYDEQIDRLMVIRKALNELDVPDVYKQIFAFRFLAKNNLTDWKGEYSLKHLYFIYNKVFSLLKVKIKNDLYFRETTDI